MFHNCGFNSAGLMLSGGCAEQLALWILNGQPDLHMYNYDIRSINNIMAYFEYLSILNSIILPQEIHKRAMYG